MKFSTIPCLFAALCSATATLASALQEPAATPATLPEVVAAEATPAPELVDDAKLE